MMALGSARPLTEGRSARRWARVVLSGITGIDGRQEARIRKGERELAGEIR